METYCYNESAGAYDRNIQLKIDKEITITYKELTMGGRTEFTIKGAIINREPNYIITKVVNVDGQETTGPYLEIFIFKNKKIITPAYHGLTNIRLANTPRYNKHFNCAVYLNEELLSEYWYAVEVTPAWEKIKMLNGIKLLSSTEEADKGGWDWSLDKNNKICIKNTEFA